MIQNYHTRPAGIHSDMFPKPDPPPTRATEKAEKKEKKKYNLHVFVLFLSNL